MADYYDGVKLLSTKDLFGKVPEIFICTSNRTAGKTTYFNRLCVNRFLDKGQKFMILLRFKHELADSADAFFKDIRDLFFAGHEMTSAPRAGGTYYELFLDNKPCGYSVALNSADFVKRRSHLFSDTERMIFDEFQSETNHYCPKELDKLQSIHRSVARGHGKQSRYLPVYMVSNPVSIINPYYVAFGISTRLKSDTKFLRGDGFVLEQGFNESAKEAAEESGFNRAFGNSSYNDYASQGIYLNDNKAFIESPKGENFYVCTLKYEGVNYAIREYPELGIVYCDNRPDVTFPFKIAVTTDEHEVNYVMLKRNDAFISNMRFYFEKGAFRFKDLKCKEALMKAISY